MKSEGRLRIVLERMTRLLQTFGIDVATFVRAVRGLPAFIRDFFVYRRQEAGPFPLRVRNVNPILNDREAEAGVASGQYFHQDLWAARKIYTARPALHVDVGSRIDGFIAHLLVFMPVTVVDVRPLTSDVQGLTFLQEDATSLSSFDSDSVESLSCLHAVEHFGLGRYADPVDPMAPFHAMQALERVLVPGGHLYFSVPLGAERLEFNAHRVFATESVLSAFSGLDLASFSVVDGSGRFLGRVAPDELSAGFSGCGLFEFTKRGHL